MSFDIFFQPCRFSDEQTTIVNPFTGNSQSVSPSKPLNSNEIGAVREVLRRASVAAPDTQDCSLIRTNDGCEAEVFGGDDLATGCMIAVRGITADMFQFLFDLLAAGSWAMIPASEDHIAITTSPDSSENVPSDFPSIVVCNSTRELELLLTGGIRSWEKYRDQIVDGKS